MPTFSNPLNSSVAAPTRFPNGVGTAQKFSSLHDYIARDPTKAHETFIDFTGIDFHVADWTITETQAAATQLLVVSDLAGEYGIFRHTNSAVGATDLTSIQLTTVPIFIGASQTGKRWWMKSRISRDNLDESIGVGVQAVNATPFTVVNGIWMSILGASTDVVFNVTKASTASTATAAAVYATSALNTFIILGMAYDGKNTIKCYVNDVHRTSIDLSVTNNVPVVAVTPTVSAINTTANARNMDCDYLLFAVER